ncbi:MULTISPECIES: 6-phosphogluconolactonase [unclassified Luteococcus]|uniref:6-phosphogluconolactonase n=1 Tax=unclassified Luteococcus TaxID=2639923 RepID=UPI00313CB269
MSLHDLVLTIHDDAEQLGAVTAAHAAMAIRDAIDKKGEARVMLAAAPSQEPTLRHLARESFDRDKLVLFHMDDYLGLAADAPQGFGNWLETNFLDRLGSGPVFHRINPALPPEEAEADYAAVMGVEPFDLTLCGLGVNAHLAFNDPPADFHDSKSVRVVQLERRSRQQQVDEGHFPNLEAVPERALTVTIPRLLNAEAVVCSVLGRAKREAVEKTLASPPDPQVPGTALKTHPRVELHIDREAATDAKLGS